MNILEGKTLSEIAQMDFQCECGMRHYTGIRDIVIEKGAKNKLVPIVEKHLERTGHILVSMDENTKITAGDEVVSMLEAAGYQVKVHCYPGEPELVCCKEGFEELLAEVEEETRLLIAVGSGTLNDTTKYVAFKKELPFFIFATAPSMDGYASTVAPMIWEGLKYAFPAIGPTAIIADIDIIKTAPMRMRAAGFGDIVGKCISILDWKLSSLILGEEYCQMVADNVLIAMKKCSENVVGLVKGEDEALQNVMEALVLCGLMMNYVKTSRPASGSEHNFSHAVELMQLYHGQPMSMHGESVGVGSVVSSVLYRKFRKEVFDYAASAARVNKRSRSDWDEKIKALPVAGTSDMLKMEDELGKNKPENCLKHLQAAMENMDQIMDAVDAYAPEPEVIAGELKACQAMSTPQELGISKEDFQNAVLYAKDMRYRYSLLQLIWDMGKEEEYLKEVTEFFYG